MTDKLKVLYRGPLNSYSGYGRDGTGLCRALVRWGCDVYVEPSFVSPPLPADVAQLLTKHLQAPFDLLIQHSDPDNLGISEVAAKCSDVKVGWCADTETEIFTRRGWLHWDEVSTDDQALGIDPVTGVAQWQQVERVYRSEPGTYEMFALEHRGHSSLTTLNHRWIIRDRDGQLSWRTSETLRPEDRIVRSAPVQVPEEAKYSDAFVELVAWTYTEGWLERGKSVRIGQNERVYPEKTQRIRAALYELLGEPRDWQDKACVCCGRGEPDGWRKEDHAGHGWIRARGMCHACYMRQSGRGALGQWDSYRSWTESPQKPDGMVIFNLSRPASLELLAACPGKVPSREFLLGLTQAQLELFIYVSLIADGSGYTFSQALGPRMDAFVSACILAGKQVTRVRPVSEPNSHLGTVRITSDETRIGNSSCGLVKYSGVVWCPTVRHGNWLARRDNTVYYTGNSMWEFSQARPLSHRVSSFAKRMRYFDLALMYDSVALEAWKPHGPKRLPWAILQGGYESADWKHYQDRDWFGERFQYCLHGQLHNRKQPYVLIEAFNQLKHERPGGWNADHPEASGFDSARLALHTTIGDPLVLFGELIPGMKVWHEMWEKPVLDDFYKAAHVMVCPSRGEGKNLPALEFMTTGGVVAATAWGGHTQWLSGEYAYPLDYTLTPTDARYPDQAHDAKVSVATVKDVLWHTFTHRGEAKVKAELAAQTIPKMCDWSTVIERFWDRVRDNVPDKGEVLWLKAHALRRG